jgi:hypothetical protein
MHLAIDAVFINSVCGKLLDTSGEILSRQKRFLIWKEGVNYVQVIFQQYLILTHPLILIKSGES